MNESILKFSSTKYHVGYQVLDDIPPMIHSIVPEILSTNVELKLFIEIE